MVTTILIGTIINAAFTALVGLLISFILGWIIRHILANAKIGHWRNLYDERDAEYRDLDGRYTERNRLVGKLEKEVGSWKSKLDPLNVEIDGLKSQVGERDGIIAKFKSAPDWEAKYSNLKIDVDRQADELGILKTQKLDLEKETEDLKRKSSTVGAATDDLKKQLDEWRQKYESVKPNLKGRDDELGELKIKMAGKDSFISELKTKVAELERNQGDPRAISAMENDLTNAKSKATDLEAKLADCNSKRTSLEATNGDLLKQVETAKASSSNVAASAGVAALAGGAAVAGGADTAKLEAENKKLQEDLEKSHNEYNSLVAKNNKLESSIKKLEESEDESEDDKLNKIKSRAASIDFGRIGTGDAASKDDLTKIKGVGKFSEKKMNALGIYHYRQIANFTNDDVLKVEDAIEFFPGRIQRDDWVGQAKILLGDGAASAQASSNSNTAAAAAPPPAPKPASTGDAKKDEALNRIREKAKNIDFGRIGTADASSKDDLKEISGIGPFLETKLNTLGIYTFKQIANFNDDDIDKVNDAIEFFPGRIRRDDWVGQAKTMV